LRQTEDVPWGRGVFHDYWPNGGGAIHAISADALRMFAHKLWLGRFSQPSVQGVGDELGAMVNEILRAPPAARCTLTVGGTESNFLAVLGAREAARDLRPRITAPEIVMPNSAYPSFDQAAFYLGLSVKRVPVGGDLRADTKAIADAVTGSTVMIVASAPGYPHGGVDPIREIAAIAAAGSIWFHVDACVGGFLLPFLRKLGRDLPDFNFSIPGVTSISVDMHKYGYAPHGISALVARDEAAHAYHSFRFTNWPRGKVDTPTFVGSRGAGPIAAAWVIFKTLGEEGFLDLAREVERSTARMTEGIAAIPSLRMIAEPEAGIFVFAADGIDIEAVAEAMLERGYQTSLCHEPTGIHLTMEPVEDDRYIDAFLENLAAACDDVRVGDRTAAGGGFPSF
jgi:sphinganine-1-phosphate aldolase